jgi:predicted nucleic acid-binding protein
VILVDTSVWIDHLRGTLTGPVAQLRLLIGQQPLLVGDLVLCEVLRGVRSVAQARTVEAALRRFAVISIASPYLAVKAADHYRTLRARGVTVCSTVDLFIGTFCIEHGHALLHSDRDFQSMERFLGLQTV